MITDVADVNPTVTGIEIKSISTPVRKILRLRWRNYEIYTLKENEPKCKSPINNCTIPDRKHKSTAKSGFLSETCWYVIKAMSAVGPIVMSLHDPNIM